jgi:taurine dioxygenase
MLETQLSPRIASEVSGIDARHLTTASFELLAEVFHRRGVLVLRDQHLNANELLAFSSHWGTPWLGPMLKATEGQTSVATIRNRGKAGTVTEYWHCDTSFSAAPPAITMLSAVQLPAVGGDTMWCDQYGLYDAMSDGMKQMLLGLRAVHYDKQRHKQLEGRAPSDESAAHPLIRTHPVTGRKSLFISGQAEHFEGMTREESRPMLDWLLSLLGQPDYVYRHRWRVGDLLMWDNRCTTHYAIHDYGDHPRFLHRVTLQGDIPR